ncbi:MAG: type VII toxin-antitoxin system HepT family RNase toxin [Vicinamibacteria bacterium]
MVDKTVLANKIASVRDAVARIRAVLPPDVESFEADRTVREVVVLNLFVALQECVALAAHRLADSGAGVPAGYRELFLALAQDGVLDASLAQRLAAASGLRNLVAHQDGVLQWNRIYEIASSHLDDLLSYCEALASEK